MTKICSCGPQNHSPQSGQESVKKVEKTSEGTPSDASKEVIFCQNTEGTFNLSEKIVYDIDDRGNKEFCRKEDIKTFIKKLKEMIEFEVEPLPNPLGISRRLNGQIDKLAGDELI